MGSSSNLSPLIRDNYTVFRRLLGNVCDWRKPRSLSFFPPSFTPERKYENRSERMDAFEGCL